MAQEGGLGAALRQVTIPAGGAEIVVDTPGVRPSAAIAWWSSGGGVSGETENRGGIGLWTPEGAVATGWASASGAPVAHASQAAVADALVAPDVGGDGLALRGHAQLMEDGLRVVLDDPPASAWTLQILALGGPEVATDVTGWHDPVPDADGGALDLLLPTPPAAVDGATTEGALVGLGARVGDRVVTSAFAVGTGSPPGEVVGAQRWAERWPAVPSAAATPPRVACLRIRGLRASLGASLSPTAPGRRAEHVGFDPVAVLLLTWGLGASADEKRIGRLAVGGWSGHETACTSWDQSNGDDRVTAAHASASSDRAVVVGDTLTGGVHACARVHARRGGLVFDWDRSDGKTREVAYVALASPDAPTRAPWLGRRALAVAAGLNHLRG